MTTLPPHVNEEELRRFIEHAPVAIAMFDPQMRYLAASTRWQSDYGLSDQLLPGRSHYDIFPEISEHWKAVHRRCLAGATEHNEGELFVRADGDHQWVRWTVQPWRTSSDAIGGIAIFSEDVTKRALAEQALKENEQRLRLALDAAGAGTWIWDARTNASSWDFRFEVLYGIAETDARNFDTWAARLHEEDRAHVLAELDHVRRTPGRDKWDMEFRVVLPDGTVTWHHGVGRAEWDQHGTLTHLTGIDLDITSRKRTEASLRDSLKHQRDAAETVRLLFETAAQGIVSVDAEGMIVSCNAALESMFGYAVGELIGRPIESLLPASLHERHVRHRVGYVAAPAQRPMGIGMDLAAQRKDGSPMPVEVSLNHIATSTGALTIALVTDISTRKAREDLLRSTQHRLEFLLTATPATIYSAKASGDFAATFVSANVQELTGHVAQQFLRDPGFWLDHVHPDDRADVLADTGRAIAQAKKYAHVYRFRGADDHYRWMEDHGRPITNERGEVVEFVGHWTDVTEAKLLREELEESHADLRRLVAAQEDVREEERKRIAREIHDDLQQTLAAIKIDLALVNQRLHASPESVAQMIAGTEALASAAVTSTRRIINGLRPQTLDDLGLTAALEELLRQFGERTGIDCVLEGGRRGGEDLIGPSPAATCLYRITQEALNNVAKHASASRVVVQVPLPEEDRVLLRVQDNGRGMGPEDRRKSRSFGLLGMQERLHGLGGTLKVHGTPDRGATVEAALPI